MTIHEKVSSLVVVIWIALTCWAIFPDQQGTDFFPLYTGAQFMLRGESPYSPEVARYLSENWSVAHAIQGPARVAYPLPALFVMIPFACIDLPLAVYIWVALLIGIAILGSYLSSRSPHYLLVLITFYPLYQALDVKTSSVLWFGLIGIALSSWKQLPSPILGGLVATICMKPQAGMLFAVFIIQRSLVKRRENVAWIIAWFMVFIVGGLIILPSWPGEWLTNVELYMQEVSRVYLFHYFVVFLLVLCRQPWVLCLALAQVCFFPIVDIYGSLPLLFGIFCFRLPVALTLSGITWLMPFAYGDPNSSSSLLLFVLGPYLVVALLVSAGNLKRYQAIRGWLLRDELNCLYT